MAFRRARFRRRRGSSRRRGYGRRRRYSSGGLTSRLARKRVMSNTPFGRPAGSLAPRKMFTKLENVHYFFRANGAAPAQLSGSTAIILTWPSLPWYQGTNNNFNGAGWSRGTATDQWPLGWQNYYGLYKQFVVTGVKYHVQAFSVNPATSAATNQFPTTACTILPVPQDPNQTAGTMYPSTPGAAQTAPNARTQHLRSGQYGSPGQIVSFKGYIPMSVLQGQDIYDDRFYQNTFPQGEPQTSSTSASASALALYYQMPTNVADTTVVNPPAWRVSLRWYITFFDVRMFNVVT